MKRTLFLPIVLATAFNVLAEPLPVVTPETLGLSSDKLAKIDDVVEKFIAKKELASKPTANATRRRARQ